MFYQNHLLYLINCFLVFSTFLYIWVFFSLISWFFFLSLQNKVVDVEGTKIKLQVSDFLFLFYCCYWTPKFSDNICFKQTAIKKKKYFTNCLGVLIEFLLCVLDVIIALQPIYSSASVHKKRGGVAMV